MRNVRRFYVPNAIVFITAVTNQRQPLFERIEWQELLFETMRKVRPIHPFHLIAYTIMPDHLHWLMWTPENGSFSQVMHSIKRNFTLNYKSALELASPLKLWQDRFWDHVIRNEDDLWHHFDYIHYNPVKHGLTTKPEDWTCSSYQFWIERGYYDIDWGHVEPEHIKNMGFE